MLGTLCTLITALTCVSGVTVVTQKPPVVTLRKGETATMDCNLGTVTNSAARWYKQTPGGVPQFVLYFYHPNSAPTYGSGFSSPKFTSNHQSTSDYRLIINNVEEGDSAVYYCNTWDSSVNEHSHFRCALNNLPHGPKSFPLHTGKFNEICLFSLPTESKGLAEVTWFGDGCPVSSGISTSTAVHQPDHTFQISSYFSIKPSQWLMDKVFTCKVSWGSQSSKKNITMSDCHMN
uniref:Immunoglobulin lambda-1 light chain-like n=1 Tax=Seriola lalandi dorsalis TaxID=1841481 RepID=A0A3B4YLI2_SERLL